MLFSRELVNGNKDSLIVTSYEKSILPAFKARNRRAIELMDYRMIGLEDYLFIHHMFCRDKN